MISTGVEISRSALGLLTATLAAIVAGLTLIVLAFSASPASAHIGPYYYHDVPNYKGADADVAITAWATPGTTDSKIVVNNRYGSGTVYVQARPVFNSTWSQDGYWKRATSTNVVRGSSKTFYWSDRTHLDFDAYQYRLCKPIYNWPDTCGSVVQVH